MLQPGQVQVENVASEVQNVSTVSTVVSTRTGRVVASEVQVFAGPSAGLSLVPGAAYPESQWAIPQAQEVGGSSEIDVFNPGAGAEARDRAPSPAVRSVGPADRPRSRRWLDVGPGDERPDADPPRRDLLRRRSTPPVAPVSS